MRVNVISMTETEIVLEGKEEFMFMYHWLNYCGEEREKYIKKREIDRNAIKLWQSNGWSKLNRILGLTEKERQKECQENKEA